MSARLCDRILEADIPSRTIKLVLMKLAKHASDRGERIFPSVSNIARVGQCSKRQAQRILGELRTLRILICVREGGHGRGRATEYAFSLQALDELHDKGWDAYAAGLAPSAEQERAERAACGLRKGDAMVSPLDAPRVTFASAQSDTRCHPIHQDEASRAERARARVQGSGAEPGSTIDGHARQACCDDLSFEAFQAAWPGSAASNPKRARRAWLQLSFVERQAALAGIQPFLAAWAAAGRTYAIASETYLAERRWLLATPSADHPAARAPILAPWSRDWWQVVLLRLASGKKVGFAFTEARSGRGLTVGTDELRAAGTAQPRLHQVEADSAEAEAWRTWLARRGARLPDGGEPFDLMVPSRWPPRSEALSQ